MQWFLAVNKESPQHLIRSKLVILREAEDLLHPKRHNIPRKALKPHPTPSQRTLFAAVREGHIKLHARHVRENLLRMDEQHPRLVHLASAVVGPSHPRVALQRLRQDHCFALDVPVSACVAVAASPTSARKPTCSTPGSASGLLPFTVFGWPGPRPLRVDLTARNFYPRPRNFSSPASTSSSSGSRG